MDFTDTLTEVMDEMPNKIEKPKRMPSEKQLAALSAAREKRKTKATALDKAKPAALPPPPVLVRNPPPPFVEPAPVAKKQIKKKTAPKPTVIQFADSESESGSDGGSSPRSVIIIRRPKKREPTQPPAPPPTPLPSQRRIYIRRAY